MSQTQIVACGCECIVRHANGQLQWIGQTFDPLAKAVDRVNEGTASEIDLDCLSAFPVFDHDAPENGIAFVTV